MALAGGGFQGGHVIGASDKNGEQVADRPVYPNDIVRSILVQLGIDPDTQLTTPTGTKVAAAPSIWSPDKKGGLLTEIM